MFEKPVCVCLQLTVNLILPSLIVLAKGARRSSIMKSMLKDKTKKIVELLL